MNLHSRSRNLDVLVFQDCGNPGSSLNISCFLVVLADFNTFLTLDSFESLLRPSSGPRPLVENDPVTVTTLDLCQKHLTDQCWRWHGSIACDCFIKACCVALISHAQTKTA